MVLWKVFLWHIMWVNLCHKPPMIGNGLYIAPIRMVMTWGMVIIVLPILT